MSKPQRANRDLIKAMNRNLVLNTIRTKGPVSRTQLTEITGLSVGAVSQISNELLNDDWILAAGEGDYTGGRRQMMLRLNPAKGYVVGLKLMEERIVCALTDLETNILEFVDQPLICEHTPEAISQSISEVVKQTLFEANIARTQVLGVGVGLAGVIDHQLGILHYSPFFQWRNIALSQLIEAQLSMSVYLENDVNALTITEQLFGPGRTVENFVVVTVGRGVGMGMVLNNRLYRGTQGGTGELGHVIVDPDGPQCDCGKIGCLEALAADPAVIRYVESNLPEPSSTLNKPLTLSDIVAASKNGDQLARDALAQSGTYLGMGLAMVINILHPSLILVSGEGVVAGDFRLKPMFESLRQHTLDGLLDDVEIVIEPTNDETWARGAAGFVVGKVFESPLVKSTGVISAD